MLQTMTDVRQKSVLLLCCRPLVNFPTMVVAGLLKTCFKVPSVVEKICDLNGGCNGCKPMVQVQIQVYLSHIIRQDIIIVKCMIFSLAPSIVQ